MNNSRLMTPFAGPAVGDVSLPGSKSHTNRALLCAALSEGTSRLSGVLFADDTEAMLEAIVSLGATVKEDRQNLEIEVTGLAGALNFWDLVIDARLSGTTSRFLLPTLAAGNGVVTLDGAQQLRSRPFVEQIEALRNLGCDLEELGAPGQLPVKISSSGLEGGEVEISAEKSSQFVSGLMLAAPLYSNGLKLRLTGPPVSRPYLELTIKVMRDFGVLVEEPDEFTYIVPAGRYRAIEARIEPDASAASYFFAAASITQGRVKIAGLHGESYQGDVRFVDVLEQLGAKVIWGENFIEVEGDRIRGGTFDLRDFSDTAQTLAALAAFAEGDIEITGIGFIRRKETDRIAAMVTELAKCGVEAIESEDGLIVRPNLWSLRGASIDTYSDHRMAMSMALLSLRIPRIVINDHDCVAKTFPAFFSCLEELRPKVKPRGKVVAVVAIDGPAGSGKSTVARLLARELNLPHFDTGAMYRAVVVAALRAGIDPENQSAMTELAEITEISISELTFIDGLDATDEIRTPEINQWVSIVAANPGVRRVLVARQRKWATELGGGVMEGRDIGTEVFPDAMFKAFLTAQPEVRARRRFEESSVQTLGDVTDDLERRDRIDSTRADSPLQVAAGAVVVDTSELTIQEVVSELASIFRSVVED
jgi:3-phosphoshikimate 1-carboxyvinyltransferase